MEKREGYEKNLANTGAQEAAALRKTARAVKKGTAVRGKDLRSK